MTGASSQVKKRVEAAKDKAAESRELPGDIMTQQQNVLSWLKDAHAIEQGAVLNLENHAAAAEGYPEVQSKLYEHAEATRQHALLIERCIERLGGHPSVLKEAIGTVMGKVQGVANLPAQDTVVKNALGDLSAEHFEIASYTSLIAAAEQAGDEETAIVCRRILHDEEEMAGWLRAQIPIITRQFLAEQTGEESRSPQAQVLGSVKDSVQGRIQELKEQSKDLAVSAKQSGKSALITSGALLAGAGAGLLIVQALRSGAAEKQRAQEGRDEGGAYGGTYGSAAEGEYDRAGDSYAGESAEPLSALDLHSESLDSSEPFVQNSDVQDSDLSTVLEPQTEEPSDGLTGQGCRVLRPLFARSIFPRPTAEWGRRIERGV
jgi:ferritin-like metal-binding protein YciE